MIGEVPTVKRLRAVLAFGMSKLSRLEEIAKNKEGDAGGDATLDAIMYHKEVIDPIKKLLSVAESAARETAGMCHPDLLFCLVQCKETGTLLPLERFMESLAAEMLAAPSATEEEL